MKETAALRVTTPAQREIVSTRALAANRDAGFDALIEPAQVRRWILGPSGIAGSLRDLHLRDSVIGWIVDPSGYPWQIARHLA